MSTEHRISLPGDAHEGAEITAYENEKLAEKLASEKKDDKEDSE